MTTTRTIETNEGSFLEEQVIQAGLRSIARELLPHLTISILDAMARDCADDKDLSTLFADRTAIVSLRLPNINALHAHGRYMMDRRLLKTLTPATLQMAYDRLKDNREVWLEHWKMDIYLALHPAGLMAQAHGFTESND